MVIMYLFQYFVNYFIHFLCFVRIIIAIFVYFSQFSSAFSQKNPSEDFSPLLTDFSDLSIHFTVLFQTRSRKHS